jgi:DNA-binding SARP family transcriptional activator/tetratricopeptide (TPR) repeat protein
MSDQPSRLELRLLGPVDVFLDGRPLVVDTRKAIGLLAYLAVAGREQSRDHLVDLLWPGSDAERGRGSLRRTLSALRAALGDRWVEADRTRVRFVPDDHVSVDVERFLAGGSEVHDHAPDLVCPKCIDSLSRAGSLYRGDFIEGFTLRGCPAFDDWLMAEGEHLRRKAASVFERWSKALAEEGRYPESIVAARRWLAVDPLHERAHRTLMLLHAWSGERSASVEVYRTCVAMLDRELGVSPLEETTELYEAILEEDLPRAPAITRRVEPAPPPAIGYPFVGRAVSIERIQSIISAGSGLIVVEGELGTGKTRLLEELASRVPAPGRTVVVGRAHRTEVGVAYGPIQSILAEALDRPEYLARLEVAPSAVSREAARLLPALGEAPSGDLGESAARSRFLDALSQMIAMLDDRVVLAIDNLHWADGATIELIGYLASRLSRLGIVLVLTVRPEDTLADHPVSVLLGDLGSVTEVIRLGPLDAAAVGELVRVAGVDGLDPQRVLDTTSGLPFFVIEYLESARSGVAELPAAVRRLLLGRLSELQEVERQLLATAAVIGRAVEADLIRAVSGRSEEEVVAGLDLLIRRSILKESPDGTLDFSHDQLREVVYEETTLVRRRLLHARAAEHLLARPRRPADPRFVAAAAAHHRLAGNDIESARLEMLAGELAVGVFAFGEAIAHYEAALALGHPDGPELHRRIGDLHTLAGRYGQALAAFEVARASLPSGSPESALVARAIGEVYARLRRWEMASASLSEAWDSATDPGFRTRLASDWAFVEHSRGNGERARELATQALRTASDSGDPEALARAHNLAGLVAEDSADRIGHLAKAMAQAAEPSVQAAILNNLAVALAATGDLEGALARGRRALDLAGAAGDRHRMAAIHDNLADFLHEAGDETAAMEELKQAAALFADVGIDPGELEPEVWLLKQW